MTVKRLYCRDCWWAFFHQVHKEKGRCAQTGLSTTPTSPICPYFSRGGKK